MFQDPTTTEIPKMVKEIYNQTQDLNEFKALSVPPQVVEEQKQKIETRVQDHLQNLQPDNVNQIKTLLQDFKEDFEQSLITLLQSYGPSQETKQRQDELQTLTRNQKRIRQAVDTQCPDCDLEPTKSSFGRKQNNLATRCRQVYQQKRKQNHSENIKV